MMSSDPKPEVGCGCTGDDDDDNVDDDDDNDDVIGPETGGWLRMHW